MNAGSAQGCPVTCSVKLKFRELLNKKKTLFFTVKTVHCTGLAREVVESPSLDILEIKLDRGLGNLLQVAQL